MERALEGVSAAPGVAIGPAIVLDRRTHREAQTIPPERRAEEAARAASALETAAAELEAIAARLRDEGRGAEADIVETGVLMAGDPNLVEGTRSLAMLGMPAEDALLTAAGAIAAQLDDLDDPTLAARADDVRSVARRAAARATGTTEREAVGVLVARVLGPADVAEHAPHAIGIALAAGGVTSHAAIVARSLGVPMLIALGSEVLDVADGEEVVIDGNQGILVRSPNAERAASVRAGTEQARAAREVAIARRAEPAITRDGRRVHVLANASTVPELEEAIRQGAEGVGLLRTELLFLEATAWPTFEQQVGVLKPVLARLAGQVATVRLFDFGADKTPPFLRGITARGIEVLLDAPEQMQTHLRAVIDAASGAELRILIPMVTDVDQVRAVRRVVGAGVQVGAMIETPEAARDAFAIARESDFLSIGTNDLTQLALGLDREQSRKAPVMDERVLRLIAESIRAARRASIPVAVCGEAASDAKAMPVMIGFGADELSVAPARVGQVRQWIRELDFAEAEKKAEALLHESRHARRERV